MNPIGSPRRRSRRVTRARMATAAPKTRRLRLGPRSAGLLLTPAEFDRASVQEGWRYELINGVLVVSPTPSRQERGPNQTLGRWLRRLSREPSARSALDATLPEEEIQTKQNRRRVDRAIWAGLGRDPDEGEARRSPSNSSPRARSTKSGITPPSAPNSARSACGNTGSSTDSGGA